MDSWKQTTAPAALPITVAEVKANSNISTDDDDNLIARLIESVVAEAEAIMCRQLISATWRHRRDTFPSDGAFQLWYAPLQSVTHVKYYDSAGVQQTFSSSYYTVDSDREPGRVRLNYNQNWPADFRGGDQDIEVVYVAGYGDTAASVPEDIRHAMLMIVDDRYEHRGGDEGWRRPWLQEGMPVSALVILRRNKLYIDGVG